MPRRRAVNATTDRPSNWPVPASGNAIAKQVAKPGAFFVQDGSGSVATRTPLGDAGIGDLSDAPKSQEWGWI
jgi:hypothetical protein